MSCDLWHTSFLISDSFLRAVLRIWHFYLWITTLGGKVRGCFCLFFAFWCQRSLRVVERCFEWLAAHSRGWAAWRLLAHSDPTTSGEAQVRLFPHRGGVASYLEVLLDIFKRLLLLFFLFEHDSVAKRKNAFLYFWRKFTLVATLYLDWFRVDQLGWVD